MRSMKLLAGVLAAVPLLPLTSVHAGIVSVTGSTLQIAAPASVVQNGGLESYTVAAVFGETQNVTLTHAAAVDATTTGLFDSLADLTPGSISIGTLVSSYYLHADPIGSSGKVYTFKGSITFDTDILGVAAQNAQLLNTNVLGAMGTTYPVAATVNGVDLNEGSDSFTISSDRRTFSYVLAAYAGADAVRVITAGNAVPEPGALGLVLTALGALALVRRRQDARA